jgi:hypothetical protein
MPLVLSAPDAPAAQELRTISDALGTRARGLAGPALSISPREGFVRGPRELRRGGLTGPANRAGGSVSGRYYGEVPQLGRPRVKFPHTPPNSRPEGQSQDRGGSPHSGSVADSKPERELAQFLTPAPRRSNR